MFCEHFMQRPALTATENDTAVTAARMMREQRTGMVAVVDDGGRLTGTVTERDLVREVLAVDAPNGVKLSRVAKPPIRCRLRDPLTDAEARMVAGDSHYVIVCDDDGRPAGVISLTDLARHEDARRAANVLYQLATREARP